MKILWLCNLPMSTIAKAAGLPVSSMGGWIAGAYESIKRYSDIELVICFPQTVSKSTLKGRVNDTRYFGFYEDDYPEIYRNTYEIAMRGILSQTEPDLVHIFGTEFPHTLAMVKACAGKYTALIHIQGLCSICSLHYYSSLPESVISRSTFRDFLRKDNIVKQKNKMLLRGKHETEALAGCDYIIGRTEWDKACTMQINPHVGYYHCNETLRDLFYNHTWHRANIEKHSIFICQSNYPIKGFHFALLAMPEIIRRYPDARLYTTGRDCRQVAWYRKNSYQKYLCGLMDRLELNDHVVFLNSLSEAEMCARLLRSEVYLMASSIENSPNSLGEAMILGVPCVSSDVGGVSSQFVHMQEGYMYPYDEPYMIVHYICKLFDEPQLADAFAGNAKIHARKTYCRENNADDLIRIYHEIGRKQVEKYEK